MAPAYPKKEPRKPNVPMRKLNWAKVPDPKVKGTVWEVQAADDKEAAALDTKELEELFGTKAAAAPKEAGGEEEGGKGKRSSTKTVEKVALIDPKRATAISTVIGNLKSMKLDVDTCITALLNADISKLENPRMPVEMVLSLLSNTMPQPDEVEMLEAYDGPREVLRDVEKWLLKVKEGLPQYEKRANALVARAAFANTYAEEAGVMKRVHETAMQIKESHTLVRLLSKTLAIGNYLNGTSRQGGAYGFKLGGLAELQSCKSLDGKMTLLHYLAKLTATAGPDSGPLVDQLRRELSAFDDPVRFEWATVSGEVAKMAKSMKSMQTLVEADEVAAFKSNMAGFLKEASAQMAGLEKLAADTSALCVELGTWFAEAKVDKEPEKFFALVGAFVKALETADKFNRDSKEREEKKRQRAIQAAKEAEARKHVKPGSPNQPLGNATNDGTKDYRAGLSKALDARKNLVDNVVEGMAHGRVRRHG